MRRLINHLKSAIALLNLLSTPKRDRSDAAEIFLTSASDKCIAPELTLLRSTWL